MNETTAEITMYARGMTTRQISEQIEEIYPIVYIDAVHFSVRQDSIIRKLAAYAILGIDANGMKDVISLQIGENESSKYWLGVLNELKKQRSQGYYGNLCRWINSFPNRIKKNK